MPARASGSVRAGRPGGRHLAAGADQEHRLLVAFQVRGQLRQRRQVPLGRDVEVVDLQHHRLALLGRQLAEVVAELVQRAAHAVLARRLPLLLHHRLDRGDAEPQFRTVLLASVALGQITQRLLQLPQSEVAVLLAQPAEILADRADETVLQRLTRRGVDPDAGPALLLGQRLRPVQLEALAHPRGTCEQHCLLLRRPDVQGDGLAALVRPGHHVRRTPGRAKTPLTPPASSPERARARFAGDRQVNIRRRGPMSPGHWSGAS
jgi:hypothetical protein